MTITTGRVLRSADVEPLRWTVESGRFLLRAEHTGGQFSLMELITPPAGGPPPHVHADEDETFYVLEGSYDIRLGDEWHAAGPGSVVFAPRGIAHGFRNTAPDASRLLCIATPGGAEAIFEELAEIFRAPGGPDQTAVAALARRRHITYL